MTARIFDCNSTGSSFVNLEQWIGATVEAEDRPHTIIFFKVSVHYIERGLRLGFRAPVSMFSAILDKFHTMAIKDTDTKPQADISPP